MTEQNRSPESDKKYCNECKNHCPIDALGCKKGKDFFGDEGTLTEKHGKHGHYSHEHNHGDEHRDHGHEGGIEGRIHGRNGRRRGQRNAYVQDGDDPMYTDNLYGLMRSCGHYLYHRTGRNTTQDKIISILSHRIHMTQKELQEILQIQPGSMSEILSKLEVKELIFRRKSEDDKRKIVLELTESGKLYANNQAKHNMEKELFSVLDEKEYETLEKLLKKLLDSWKLEEKKK